MIRGRGVAVFGAVVQQNGGRWKTRTQDTIAAMSEGSDWSEYTLDSSDSSSDECTAKVATLSISSRSGGYDYEFLEEPDDDLKCSICLSVLRDPHLTSCCGNHFCETCITPIKTKTKRCPLCQERNFTSMLNKSLNRSLNELIAYCPNNGKGCEWFGELKSVEKHLDTDCDHVLVKCPLCDVKVLRTRLPAHQTKCPRRIVACEACGQVDAWQVITGSHRMKCPCLRLSCNNCDEMVMRKNMKKHLETKCPLQQVPCEYRFAGCREESFRKDVATHANERVSYHLSLITAMFQSELSKRDEEIDSLKVTVAKQSREISELRSQKGLFPVVLSMPDFRWGVSKDRWFSEPFLSHLNGYKLCLCVYPNGTGKGAGTHLSVFAHIMLGDNDEKLSWPFRGIVHVSLNAGLEVFQRRLEFSKKVYAAATKRVTNGVMNKLGQGLPQFVELTELTHSVGLCFIIENVEYGHNE